ncbi:MAG: virulence RhuM family protein [Candidatus Paceibacterota bacterium]
MDKDNVPQKNTTAQFLIFTAETGNPKIEVRIEGEMVWLTQKLMAELFAVTVPTINEHLKNIYLTQELKEDSVVRNFRITAADGKDYDTMHYNLDAVIAVGYRVNSKQATHFRIWATQVLREFIIKGFALDDERLKQGKKLFGVDYFRELLERVRSIRASERRIYQQITDIFAECSIDYDPDSDVTHEFYAMVQNKFHFAITGKTAPEIIYTGADATLPNMGLTTWKKSPTGRVLQSDVTIAKNYLREEDIKQLERTVTGFFDYIEGLIARSNTFTMEEFAESVDKFLTFNEYKILDGKGRISKADADAKAVSEYKEFNKHQQIESDFDKQVKKIIADNKLEE